MSAVLQAAQETEDEDQTVIAALSDDLDDLPLYIEELVKLLEKEAPATLWKCSSIDPRIYQIR
jgi:hypothetical protein